MTRTTHYEMPAPIVAPPSILGTLSGQAQRTRVALERYGVAGLAQMVARRIRKSTAECFTPIVRARLANAKGLEIGGPSAYLFGKGGYLPAYPLAARVDNVNFAAGQTTWENVVAGDSFLFDASKAPGTQFVGEATNLPMINDGTYDFVLSSHTIEHTANPLGALREWRRAVRKGGLLLVVAPDPTRTFDRRRPITRLAHLIDDEARGMGESDMTHLDEIIALHDLALDPWAPQDTAAFAERCSRNADVRCLHHHVFDLGLLRAAAEHVGFHVLSAERALPDHLIVVAEAV